MVERFFARVRIELDCLSVFGDGAVVVASILISEAALEKVLGIDSRLLDFCLTLLLGLNSCQTLLLGLIRLAFLFSLLRRFCLAILLCLNDCKTLLLGLVRLAFLFSLLRRSRLALLLRLISCLHHFAVGFRLGRLTPFLQLKLSPLHALLYNMSNEHVAAHANEEQRSDCRRTRQRLHAPSAQSSLVAERLA